MCEFYLNGKCFHSERINNRNVATTCNAHGCKQCTSKDWQKQKLREDLSIFDHLPMQEISINGSAIEAISSVSSVLRK